MSGEGKMQLLVLGDSHFRKDRDFHLDRLWGVEDITSLDIPRSTQKAMQTKFEAPCINAYSGQGLLSMKDYVISRIRVGTGDVNKHQVIYLQLGGNDIRRSNFVSDVEEVEAALRDVLSEAANVHPRTHIIVGSMLPSPCYMRPWCKGIEECQNEKDANDTFILYNRKIRQLCKNFSHVARFSEIHKKFSINYQKSHNNAQVWRINRDLYTKNDIHLNYDGGKILTKEVANALMGLRINYTMQAPRQRAHQ